MLETKVSIKDFERMLSETIEAINEINNNLREINKTLKG